MCLSRRMRGHLMCGCGTAREIPVGCSKKLLLTCRVATQHRTRARHTKSTAGLPLPAFDQLSTLGAFDVRCSRASLPSMSGNPLYSLLCEGWVDRWLACIQRCEATIMFFLHMAPLAQSIPITHTTHAHRWARVPRDDQDWNFFWCSVGTAHRIFSVDGG